MNKNIKILLGVLGLLIITIAIYLATQGGARSLVNFGNNNAQKNSATPPQISKGSVPSSGPGSMPAAPSKPTVYLCKEGKTVTLVHTTSGLTITLTDSTGKRNVPLILNVKKSTVNPTFQSKDGGVVFISKGTTVVVEEKGVATFTGCSLSK